MRLMLRRPKPLKWITGTINNALGHVPQRATVSVELGKEAREKKMLSSLSLELEKRGTKVSSIIAGVGKYLPDNIVTSASIEKRLDLQKNGIPENFIEAMTGVVERRHVLNGDSSSDLAARASLKAMEQAGVSADEIDVIIFASATHDMCEPATANMLQEKLEAWNAHVFDVKNACNSFVNAIDVMDSFIRTGRCRIGLIAAGEVLSACINWNVKTLEDMKLGLAGLTLGDGGGAMVIKAGDDDGRGIRASHFTSDGSGWPYATVLGGGTCHPRDPSKEYFLSDSLEIAKMTMKNLPGAIRTALQKAGWRSEELDLVVPHQVTIQLIDRISKMAALPRERVVVTVNKYGNTAAASIPIALAEAMEAGRVQRGDKVLLIGGAAGWSGGIIAAVL
ncbi:MAG: ketoacyl-ACP synthase III [Dehalococcoidia bacterium]|nr:ketoacyl-ACP synthase III [Dehalococcoidia bacterium]